MAAIEHVRAGLRRSLENPHPETAELAGQGLEDWSRGLPQDDPEALVDSTAGKAVRWVPGKRLGGGSGVKLGRGAVVVVEIDPTVGHERCVCAHRNRDRN